MISKNKYVGLLNRFGLLVLWFHFRLWELWTYDCVKVKLCCNNNFIWVQGGYYTLITSFQLKEQCIMKKFLLLFGSSLGFLRKFLTSTCNSQLGCFRRILYWQNSFSNDTVALQRLTLFIMLPFVQLSGRWTMIKERSG